MRVFVTGGSGFIGSPTVRDLLAAGHQVLSLARSDASAAALERAGAAVHRGDLTDLDSLAAGARACDGVIHLAFIHDFAKWDENIRIDRAATAALARALEGSGKPLVNTSGTALLEPGRLAIETDVPPSGGHARAETEGVLLAFADRGVRAMVMRLPPTVHGAGDKAFVPMIIDVARKTGVSAYVGDGANRWSAVHRFDAARCFRLALEQGASGMCFHAVAEEGVPMRAIAETIGQGLGVPVKSITADEARDHFGWMASFVGMDNPASSVVTRDTLGWEPNGPDLLTDLRENGYFA